MTRASLGWVAAVFVWALAVAVSAQPELKVVSEGPDAPAGARRLVLHSDRLGADFAVVISAPSGPFVRAGERLPAIYALDGGYGVAGPLGQLMAWSATMSPAYVVAIGYPEGLAGRRETDMMFRPTVRNGVTVGGGGAAFETFLAEDLRPFLEARYPFDPSNAILFGHSDGGLFAADVLAETPGAFAGYIIASPSVAADPQLLTRLSTTISGGRRVYVAVGGREDSVTIEGATRIAAILGRPGSTDAVESRVFANEGHIAYYPELVPAAFAWMLPPPAAPVSKHTAVTVAPGDLERFTGVYAVGDGRTVTISVRGAKLYALLTGSPEGEFEPETPLRFFTNAVPGYDITLAFEAAADGPASALVFSVNGVATRAVRRLAN